MKPTYEQLEAEVKALKEKAICSMCGGTDLVCGKGHLEATDELKQQVREAALQLVAVRERLAKYEAV